MPSTAVPKAAVNKDGESLAPEDEVRAARERLMATPTEDAGRAEDGSQFQFGGFVSFRADGGHDLAALCLCENVGHGETLSLFSRYVSDMRGAVRDNVFPMNLCAET
jgi:hypothetical protein